MRRSLLAACGCMVWWGCESRPPQPFNLARPAPPQGSPGTAAPAAPKKAFGIYQWAKDASYQDGMSREIATLGTPPAYALYFVDLRRGFPADVARFNADRNIQTIVTQELCEYGEAWNENVLNDIARGRWDEYFRRFAAEAKAYGGIVYYRFGYEMNGDWVWWGEKPRPFQRAWRHAFAVFQRAGARNVKWVWSPNVIWGDRTFARDIQPYYPGDKYVDVVGLDGYNFGERHHGWQNFAQVFAASITGMKLRFPKKPLWITEVGCAEGSQKADWVQDFLQSFNADPALRMFVWFNEDKRYAGEPNWRLDSDEDSMHHFRDWAVFNNSITTFSLPAQPASAPLTRNLLLRRETWL